MKTKLLNLIRVCKNRRELSRKAKVGLSTINNWLYEGIEPTISNAEKVLDALGYEIVIKEKNH